MSNFDLKVKFDTAFDNIFFTKEFKDAMINEFGICPAGTTLDTKYDDENSEIYFEVVSKVYGYEYSSSERVIGDYSLNKFNFTEDHLLFLVKYLKEKNPELVEEIKNYDFCY